MGVTTKSGAAAVLATTGGANRRQRRRLGKQDLAGQAASLVDRLFRAAVEHHQAGRLDEAEDLYRRILTLDPRHADGLHWLGVVHYQRGRCDAALELIERAIALRGDNHIYRNSLALTLCEQGKLAEAADCYERVLALQPDGAERYHNNLGVVNERQGRLAAAEACYRRSLDLQPDYVEALNNLGCVLHQGRRLAEAAACFQRVLVLAPGHAAAHNNLGLILRATGRLDEASRHFEAAIGVEPRNPRFYSNLGDTKRFHAADPHLAAMAALAGEAESLTPQNRIELHFALAKAYADLADHDRSFDHMLEGNRLRRQQGGYNEQRALATFRRIRQIFTTTLPERDRPCGEPSAVPVFIIGMPRSGTTLVEQILASHPEVHGAGEIDDFNDAVNTEPVGEDFPDSLASLDGDALRRIGTAYIDRIRRLAPSAGRITNKLPGNFLHVGLIRLVLPNARIIHVRRDPLDTCLSCFSKLFVRGEFTYDLAELGRYYAAYRTLLDHWRRVLPEDAMLEVAYEELVGDVEREARRIVAYCGLDWHPSCLAFHESARPVYTASAVQVRQPIYDSSIGRWRAYAHRLQPLIAEIGVAEGEPTY